MVCAYQLSKTEAESGSGTARIKDVKQIESRYDNDQPMAIWHAARHSGFAGEYS